VTKELPQMLVAADTYEVSPEPVVMIAELRGAMALCLHDESRGVGGLLHFKFKSGDGRPSDVTDNTLSNVLVVLDRFKKAVLGNNPRRDTVQARILAHSMQPLDSDEPNASLVDLIKADFADFKVNCGAEVVHRPDDLRVCFEPFAGKVWVCGPTDKGAATAAQRKIR
jgi:chemotaxis receptor (MCP) glutamine deamidase CheD